jgi:drug/metabolite transporter (DMT)-like permease
MLASKLSSAYYTISGEEAKIYELCLVVIVPILLWQFSANSKAECQLWFITCSWCAMSVGMQVLNKALVIRLQAPGFIAACQMAITAFLFLGLHARQIFGTLSSKPSLIWWWMPAAATFGTTVFTSIFIYEYITLSDMTLVRTVAPIAALPIEALIMAPEKRPEITSSVIGAMTIMVLGAVVYGIGAPAISIPGLTWASFNCCIVVLDRFVQRRLLSEECKDMKLEECVFVSNIFGLIAASGPAFYFDRSLRSRGDDVASHLFDLPFTALLVSSGIVGSCLCYLGICMQRVISATSSLVVQNVSRIAIFSFGVMYFKDHVNGTILAGVGFTLLGSIWYGHELIQQGRMRTARNDDVITAWEEQPWEQSLLVRGKGTGKGLGGASRMRVAW